MSEQDKIVLDDEPVEGEQTPKTEELDVKTILAQKSHWREKAKKLEEEMNNLKAQIPKPEPEKPKETVVSTDDDWKRKIEFTVTHKEYDSEDIDKLITLSKGLGVDLDKAKEDPMFKAYYSAKQEKLSEQGTTPQGRSPKVSPEKPVEQMTREEHEAYFKKLLGK